VEGIISKTKTKMKAVDFLKRVLTESKAPEVTIDSLEFDIPEDVIKAYEGNLLTLERAQADPELSRVMQARAFKALNDGWDKDFNSLAEQLDAETATKVKAEKFTRKKWEVIAESLKKGLNDDDKHKATRKEIETLHAQIKEREALLETQKQEAANQILDFKKDYLLSEKLSTVDLAEAYVAFKPMIKEQFLKNISEKSIILAVENDQLVPRKRSETGELMDVFEANTKVGLDDLIKKELLPFLKKSAGTGSTQPGTTHTTPPGTKPTKELTLDEINRLKVQENFNKLKTKP
jgi:hypothetical protein